MREHLDYHVRQTHSRTVNREQKWIHVFNSIELIMAEKDERHKVGTRMVVRETIVQLIDRFSSLMYSLRLRKIFYDYLLLTWTSTFIRRSICIGFIDTFN